ncbi:tetraspanin-32 isoform X2 [Phacochoerus africanus]|uniref:tetraspanin-32 isoform X2 n=1 Tax=Phacochoerus africanus TaxID=41426 RepID=UPI001FD9431C|nr:tetraspanin-32 isoform X2 [Phacochoerus africanus]
MGPWSRVRAAKCQMLVTSLFVLLLGLAVATMAALTYFGAPLAVISHASRERTPFEALHRRAFFAGTGLAGLLALGAVLSSAATVREARGLMVGVEDAVLDTYDLVFDRAVKNLSGIWRQELAAIQDTFLCCGKSSPLGLQGSSGADLCQGEEPARQDCLRGLGSFLRNHGNAVSTLISLGLVSTVYAVLLSAFLCFAIHSGRSLDRKGKYTLSPRAGGRQPQEPIFFRCCREGPAPRHAPEADVCEARPGPSRCLRASFLLQDTKPPTHGGGSDTAALAHT